MEYSIQQLSQLSGVTARTLRWYDEIGLLKPSRVGDNGYRYYGPDQVDRLQDILYYRALGVKLSQIRSCLDDPSFDRLSTLKDHLKALQAERNRLDRLIRSVEETIVSQERQEPMDDQQKFQAFQREMLEKHEQDYGPQARKKYGDEAVDATRQAISSWTQQDYGQWQELDKEIRQRLEEAVGQGLSPQSREGQDIAAMHRRWLTYTLPHCTDPMHKGITDLYVTDESFANNYDRNVSGCARFLRDAVWHWLG